MPMHSADQETAKAAFIDHLLQHYGITTGCYSGLWQRFQADLATQARETWASGGSFALISPEGRITCLTPLAPNGRK